MIFPYDPELAERFYKLPKQIIVGNRVFKFVTSIAEGKGMFGYQMVIPKPANPQTFLCVYSGIQTDNDFLHALNAIEAFIKKNNLEESRIFFT